MPRVSLELFSFAQLAFMFERLQKKWNVGPGRLVLILITFALGGSATGYAGRKVMPLLNIHNTVMQVVVYILVVTLIWPFAVLLISIFTGQFSFFRSYLAQLGRKLGGRKRGSARSKRQAASE